VKRNFAVGKRFINSEEPSRFLTRHRKFKYNSVTAADQIQIVTGDAESEKFAIQVREILYKS